mmetsp:Transcript_41168/g.68460  ORF Transcript_41168/g.68460 Transcript_41168/m.68460 type:complete len:123 (-) Transcript_41168:53-421(-)
MVLDTVGGLDMVSVDDLLGDQGSGSIEMASGSILPKQRSHNNDQLLVFLPIAVSIFAVCLCLLLLLHFWCKARVRRRPHNIFDAQSQLRSPRPSAVAATNGQSRTASHSLSQLQMTKMGDNV